jgi:hypothetical protein
MLEINVSDQTYVVDVVGDGSEEGIKVIEKIIIDAIKKVASEDNPIPLNILIKKPRANSPPALKISVSENIKVEDKLV